MAGNDQLTVLSVASLVGTRTIDGGDTVALRFLAPDGGEIALLVPRRVAAEVQAALVDVLARPTIRLRQEPALTESS